MVIAIQLAIINLRKSNITDSVTMTGRIGLTVPVTASAEVTVGLTTAGVTIVIAVPMYNAGTFVNTSPGGIIDVITVPCLTTVRPTGQSSASGSMG